MLEVAGSFSILLPEPPASSHCSPAWWGGNYGGTACRLARPITSMLFDHMASTTHCLPHFFHLYLQRINLDL
jgi:hypothetical protein